MGRRLQTVLLALMILAASLTLPFNCVYALPAAKTISIGAASAILTEAGRGQILYEKNSNKALHISSACKIMTTIIALETSKPDTKVTISKNSTSVKGSTLSLEAGEQFFMLDLLYAVMLTPSNDAAIAIAEQIGGDEKKFVELMNKKAHDLNLKNTYFKNATGLYDDAQYTTAYDMAVLIRYALSNQTFNTIFACKGIPWSDGSKTQVLVNNNKLFWSYNGVDGGKTGYNTKDLQTAITTATRDNMRLIAIVLDSPESSLFNDSVKLFDYGFNNFKTGTLVQKGQPIKKTTIGDKEVNLISSSDITYTYPLGENYIESIDFEIDSNLKLPVKKDRVIGTMKYYLKDGTQIEVSLFSDTEVLPPDNFNTYIIKTLKENQDLLILVFFLLFIETILIAVKLGKYITENHLK